MITGDNFVRNIHIKAFIFNPNLENNWNLNGSLLYLSFLTTSKLVQNVKKWWRNSLGLQFTEILRDQDILASHPLNIMFHT